MSAFSPQRYLHAVKGLSTCFWLAAIASAILLLAGFGFSAWFVRNQEKLLRDDLLFQAGVIGRAINNEAFDTFLTGEPNPDSPGFKRLHDYLRTLDHTLPLVHAIYLLGQRPDGHIFFFTGSDFSTLSGHSTNCTRHLETMPALTQAVQNGEKMVVGPYSSEEGRWLTALIPLHDRLSGKPLVILGIDTQYLPWYVRLPRQLPGIALLTLLLIACVQTGSHAYYLHQRKPQTRVNPLLEPLCLALFGLLFSGGIAWIVQQNERQRQTSMFQQQADNQTQVVADLFSEIRLADLEAMAGFHETIDTLTSEKFDRFNLRLAKNSLVQALAWAPLVPAAEKPAFEAAMRQMAQPDYAIWEFNAGGERIKAAQRPVYYPLAFIYPGQGNENIRGLDLGSQPDCLAALETAAATGLPTSTPPLTLDHLSVQSDSIVVCYPVFSLQNPGKLLGFTTALLQMEKLFSIIHTRHQMTPMQLSLLPGEGPARPLASSGSVTGHNTHLQVIRPIFEFGNIFLLTALPGDSFIESADRNRGLPIFLGGGLLTAALTVVLSLLMGHRQELQDQVRERTAALTTSEQEYRLLFENMVGAFALHEMLYDETGKPVDYRFIKVNPPFEQMTGLKAADIIGRSVLDVLPGTEQFWIKVYGKVVESGLGQAIQHYSSALKRHYQVWAFRTRKPFFATVFSDITEQVNMAEEVTLHFNTSVDLFCISDLHGIFQRLNPQWQETLGYEVAELTGKPFDSLIHPEDIDISRAALDSLSRKGEITGFVNRFRHADGTYRWLEWRAALGNNAIFGSARDISERRLQEIQQAEINRRLLESEKRATDMACEADSANRAKSEFLANMSHETRTPLNAVIGLTDMLQGMPLQPIAKQYVEMIGNNSSALLVILNDILDFARIEAGRLQLHPEDFDLHQLLDETIGMLGYQAVGKKLDIYIQVADHVPQWIQADSVRLRQILINLIVNAIKFTKAGEIIVQVTVPPEPAGTLRFSVRDTGIGIPTDKMDLLFKPFYQVDSATTREYGGTGLGLSISKQLCERMGGEIGVTSRPGKGTEIFFTIPLLPAQAVHPQTAFQRETVQAGIKVLFADAHPTQCQWLLPQLEAAGLITAQASSAAAALEMLRMSSNPQTFSVVVMDAHLPDLAGIELARRIKTQLPEAPPAMILLIGANDVIPPETAGGVSFSAVLRKPLQHQALLSAIAQIAPAAAHKSAAPDAPSADSENPDLLANRLATGSFRILVVDDVSMNCTVLLAMLKKFDVETAVAHNGREAIEVLAQTSFDLVLMDVQMPVMDGLNATQIIRDASSPVLKHDIIIIAVTAHTLRGDEEKCIQAGMNDYLGKPIRTRELANMLAKWLLP